MKYAHDYLERMALTDGTPILLRTLYPTDKQNLADGMRELSFLSRYERFFTPKHGLSDSELVFLTEMDEINHYAIGAGLLNPDGSEGKGLGVARFVRDVDDAQIAEPAVTVLDAWQGKGLGKLLLHHVGKAAKERGIEKIAEDYQ